VTDCPTARSPFAKPSGARLFFGIHRKKFPFPGKHHSRVGNLTENFPPLLIFQFRSAQGNPAGFPVNLFGHFNEPPECELPHKRLSSCAAHSLPQSYAKEFISLVMYKGAAAVQGVANKSTTMDTSPIPKPSIPQASHFGSSIYSPQLPYTLMTPREEGPPPPRRPGPPNHSLGFSGSLVSYILALPAAFSVLTLLWSGG